MFFRPLFVVNIQQLVCFNAIFAIHCTSHGDINSPKCLLYFFLEMILNTTVVIKINVFHFCQNEKKQEKEKKKQTTEKENEVCLPEHKVEQEQVESQSQPSGCHKNNDSGLVESYKEALSQQLDNEEELDQRSSGSGAKLHHFIPAIWKGNLYLILFLSCSQKQFCNIILFISVLILHEVR